VRLLLVINKAENATIFFKAKAKGKALQAMAFAVLS
jgi:hypothetical protein